MTLEFHPLLQERLSHLEKSGRKRLLTNLKGIDFTSNDYLGFSEDPELRRRILHSLESSDVPLGSTGSRLLSGNHTLYENLEEKLARFCGQESALLFSSGYQANIGIFSSLLGPDDMVFSDEFNHASIIDGIRLGRGQCHIYPHKNLAHLQTDLEKLAPKNGGLRVICTESIFSMDGDHAPLIQLAELAKKYGALLIVDEAHATGLFDSGLVQKLGLSKNIFATIHTGGKALGTSLAWVATNQKFRHYLINTSRSFIYSTAPSPLAVVALMEALNHWEDVGQKRAMKLLNLSLSLGFKNPSPIIPIILGSTEKTLEISQKLQNDGYNIRAIRPPTVPEGSARLRLTLKSWMTPGILSKFSQDISEYGIIFPENKEVLT